MGLGRVLQVAVIAILGQCLARQVFLALQACLLLEVGRGLQVAVSLVRVQSALRVALQEVLAAPQAEVGQ